MDRDIALAIRFAGAAVILTRFRVALAEWSGRLPGEIDLEAVTLSEGVEIVARRRISDPTFWPWFARELQLARARVRERTEQLRSGIRELQLDKPDGWELLVQRVQAEIDSINREVW